MSHTDKDLPHWVRNYYTGLIDHDHRHGECRVDTIEETRAGRTGARRWTHFRVCRKYEFVEYTCTRAEPELDYRGRPSCWKAYRDLARDEFGAIIGFRWVSPGCSGHTRRVYTADVPCSCDDWPDVAPCSAEYTYGYANRTAPRDYRHATWFGPERTREREELRGYAREYNTYGELEDGDFVNVQARGQSTWYWN